ncbi:MAG: hypothetical protein ACOZAO_01875 [Patescibacteria group bacterium]
MPADVIEAQDKQDVFEKAHNIESENEPEGRASRATSRAIEFGERAIEGMNRDEKRHHQEILNSFKERVQNLNPDQQPPDSPDNQAYHDLPNEINDYLFEQWQLGIVEGLNLITDQADAALQNPDVREAVFQVMNVIAENGIDLDDDDLELSDRLTPIVTAANQYVENHFISFNDFVERHNLREYDENTELDEVYDFRAEQTDSREADVQTLSAALEEIIPDPNAEIDRSPTMEMGDTTWGHFVPNREAWNNTFFNDSSEVLSAVVSEELRDRKGEIPKDLRPSQHVSLVSGYTRRKGDNAIVQAPILSINIKKTELQVPHNEVVTDIRKLRPDHPTVMNRRITNPGALYEWEQQLMNAVIEENEFKKPDERRVRFVTTSVDKQMKPVNKLLEVSYEDYNQMVRATQSARAQYERVGIKVEKDPEAEKETLTEFGKSLNRAEYLKTRERMASYLDAEISRLREEGNDYLADQMESSKDSLVYMYQELSIHYDSDAYHNAAAKENLRSRLEGDDSIAEGSDEWNTMLTDEIAQLRLEYSYKAVVYKDHAEYLGSQIDMLLESGDRASAQAMLLNLDKLIEIEARAYYLTDVQDIVENPETSTDEDPDYLPLKSVDEFRQEMYALSEGFLRKGTNKEAELVTIGAEMQEEWGEAISLWQQLDETFGDELHNLSLFELEVLAVLEDKHLLGARVEALQPSEADIHTSDFLETQFKGMFGREPTEEEWYFVTLQMMRQQYDDNLASTTHLNGGIESLMTYVSNNYNQNSLVERSNNGLFEHARYLLDVNEVSHLEAERLRLQTQAGLAAENEDLERKDQIREYMQKRARDRQEHNAAVRKMNEQVELNNRERKNQEELRKANAELLKKRNEARDRQQQEIIDQEAKAKLRESESLAREVAKENSAALDNSEQIAEARAVLRAAEERARAVAEENAQGVDNSEQVAAAQEELRAAEDHVREIAEENAAAESELNNLPEDIVDEVEQVTEIVEPEPSPIEFQGSVEADVASIKELLSVGELRGFAHNYRGWGGEGQRNFHGGISGNEADWMHTWLEEEVAVDADFVQNGGSQVDLITSPEILEPLDLQPGQAVLRLTYRVNQTEGNEPGEGATFNAYMVVPEAAGNAFCDSIEANEQQFDYAARVMAEALDEKLYLDNEGYNVPAGQGNNILNVSGVKVNR